MGSESRNCKIIATYFGTRRTYPYHYQNTIKIMQSIQCGILFGIAKDITFINASGS